MKSNRIMWGIVSLLALITVLVWSGFFPISGQERVVRKTDVGNDPTEIQDGVMSDKQWKHSKLYRQPAEARSLIKKVNRDVTAMIGEPHSSESPTVGFLPSREQYLPKVVCGANTILLGRVKAKSSQVSEDNKSIFTDYEVEIDDVYRNGSPLALDKGKTVTVTRSGGSVKYKGNIFTVFDKSFRFLSVDRTYLMFLDFLEDSESFKSNSIEGTFEVNGNKVQRHTDASLRYNFDFANFDDLTSFLKSSSLACNRGGEIK